MPAASGTTPVAEFDGNSAWLEIARLTWNLGKWIAQLALPDEVVRWEWKRFRQAYVYVAAQVCPLEPADDHPAQRCTPLVRVAGRRACVAPDVGALELPPS